MSQGSHTHLYEGRWATGVPTATHFTSSPFSLLATNEVDLFRSAATTLQHRLVVPEVRKQLTAVERSIEKQEQKIEQLTKGFLGIDYGTAEYDSQTKKLKQAQDALADLMKQWETFI